MPSSPRLDPPQAPSAASPSPDAAPDAAEVPSSKSAGPRLGLLGWLVPPLLLASTGFAVWIVKTGPAGMFGWVVGGLVVLALGWILVSALFPGKADRTCPACGRDTVVRIDESTRGLVCKACHYRDDNASSFFLAEEEGALEPELLARRRRLQKEPVRIRPWTGPDPATRRTDTDGDAPSPTE